MSSTQSSGSDEYSKYSAFEDDAEVSNIDSVSFAREVVASLSLADVELLKDDKYRREYSWNEFLYALSAPISLGAIGWVVSSFVAVLHGSSIVVYLNFFISLLVAPYIIKEQMPAQLLPCKLETIKTQHINRSIRNIFCHSPLPLSFLKTTFRDNLNIYIYILSAMIDYLSHHSCPSKIRRGSY